MCTIEAIHAACKVINPQGCYDDLLWYYSHIRSVVGEHGSVKTREFFDRDAVQNKRKREHVSTSTAAGEGVDEGNVREL